MFWSAAVSVLMVAGFTVPVPTGLGKSGFWRLEDWMAGGLVAQEKEQSWLVKIRVMLMP